MNEAKIYSLLSLCQKSGNLASGEFSCEKAVKTLKAKLVIVACDASDNTKKFFKDKCGYRNIDMIEYGTKEGIGKALGKEIRASVAILEEGFSKTIKELVK